MSVPVGFADKGQTFLFSGMGAKGRHENLGTISESLLYEGTLNATKSEHKLSKRFPSAETSNFVCAQDCNKAVFIGRTKELQRNLSRERDTGNRLDLFHYRNGKIRQITSAHRMLMKVAVSHDGLTASAYIDLFGARRFDCVLLVDVHSGNANVLTIHDVLKGP